MLYNESGTNLKSAASPNRTGQVRATTALPIRNNNVTTVAGAIPNFFRLDYIRSSPLIIGPSTAYNKFATSAGYRCQDVVQFAVRVVGQQAHDKSN